MTRALWRRGWIALRTFIHGALTLWMAAAGAVESQVIPFDRQLDIELMSGYPYDLNALEDQVTAGFVFRNSGPPRRLGIAIDGDVNTLREVDLPANETRRVFIYLPHIPNVRSLEVAFRDLDSGRGTPPRPLVTQGEFASNEQYPQYALARLGPIDTPVNVSTPWLDVGMLEPGRQLPDHWRGLTGVTALLVEQRQLASAQAWRQPVLDWVAMGGVLLLVAPPGGGAHDTLLNSTLPFSSGTGKNPTRVGLGYVAVVPPAVLADMQADFFSKIGLTLKAPLDYQVLTQAAFPHLRQVLAGIGQVPRWGLFVVLAGFAVAIGPLGWLLLVRRKGRPFTYLVVVMAGALLFSGTLLAVNFFIEGITPKGIANSVHLLDLRAGTEITLEEKAVFAPTAYGTQLRAPVESALLPVPLPEDYRQIRRYWLADEAAWQLVDGMIPVRQHRLIGARTLAPARGRLVITAHDDGLRVENHLPGALASLEVWHDGARYRFGALRRGEAAVAKPSPPDAAEAPPSLPAGLLLAEAEPLFVSLRKGELGRRYFIGTLVEADTERYLSPAEFRPLGAGQSLIAGLY